MKRRIGISLLGSILLFAGTVAFALAWPDRPPDRVLVSGPGIEGQVEVKDQATLAIFRLGELEDLDGVPPTMRPQGDGFHIVRFFEGGFDFARLTYYPDPAGGRGYLYFEDGPMLEGNHTPYHQHWLYALPEAEQKLRALLGAMGGIVREYPPAGSSQQQNPISSNGVPSGDPAKSDETGFFSLPAIAVLAVAAGLLAAVGAIRFRRARPVSAGQ